MNSTESRLITAEGRVLEAALDATWATSSLGLTRRALGQLHAAQAKTSWARVSARPLALVNGTTVLASLEERDLSGMVHGRSVRICGVGSLASTPAGTAKDAMRALDMVLDRATEVGFDLAMLCSSAGFDDEALARFEAVPLADLTVSVLEDPRRGAPMTLVRGGEPRDLPAIAAMGRTRAEASGFALERSADFVQDAITRRRLLAGLGSTAVEQLHFFIAEEGVTAAAYVVISVAGDAWTIEECGDRDPSGARVGALLQALIAREPSARRPTITGWLPPFKPPQLEIVVNGLTSSSLFIRRLHDRAPSVASGDVLYWHNDLF